MDDDGVKAAFELIQEEIGCLSRDLLNDAMRGVEAGKSEDVARLMETRKQLEEFQLEVKKLQQRWVDAFDAGTRSRTGFEPEPSNVNHTGRIILTMQYQSATARAELNGKDITLLSGSRVRKQTFRSMQEDILQMKNQAIRRGQLLDSDDPLLFELKTPIKFSSPSAAAVFVAGCAVNGRREWIVEGEGIPLRTWQTRH